MLLLLPPPQFARARADARSRNASAAFQRRRRAIANNNNKARQRRKAAPTAGAGGYCTSGEDGGRKLGAAVLTVTVVETEVVELLRVPDDGLTLHEISCAVAHVAENATEPVNPFSDDAVTVADPDPPGLAMVMVVGLGLVESAKSAPTRVIEAVELA